MRIAHIPNSTSIASILSDPKTTSHTKVATLLGRAIQQIEPNQAPDRGVPVAELEALGIHRDDVTAQAALCQTLYQLKTASVTIVPHEHQSGIYFLKNAENNSPFALFKLGGKRAHHELVVRELALRLGIPEYAVPSLICTLKDFEVTVSGADVDEVAGSDTVIDLWNGHCAYYVSREKALGKTLIETSAKTSKTVLGLLQPFLTPESHSEDPIRLQEKNACLLLLILAANVRDVQSNGIIGSTLVDSEQCFTGQNLPKKGENRPSIIDLPYLSDMKEETVTQPLAPEVVQLLQHLVGAWDIGQIIHSMQQKTIQFIDVQAECAQPREECEKETDEDETFVVDEGGNCLMIVESATESAIDPCRDHLDPTANPHKKLLMNDQVKALQERLTQLKDFILTTSTFSLKDLIFATDPWGLVYFEAIEEKREEGTLPRRFVTSPTTWDILGRLTPTDSKAFKLPTLHSKLEERLRTITPSTPSRDLTSTNGVTPNLLNESFQIPNNSSGLMPASSPFAKPALARYFG